MTYISSEEVFNSRLQIAEFTISGSPGLNQYFTVSSASTNNFDQGFLPTGGGTSTLSFTKGSYMFRAFLDVTRVNSNHNYKFQFEIDNTLKGGFGQTALFNNLKSDVAETPHQSNSNFNVRLKCTSVENSTPTLTSNSKIYVWRVA